MSTFKCLDIIPSSIILAALRSPRANESMAPMCAMNKSLAFVDSRRTLASKFNPPGCTPSYTPLNTNRENIIISFMFSLSVLNYAEAQKQTCRITWSITAVHARISIGN